MTEPEHHNKSRSFIEQKKHEKALWGVTRQNSLLFARRWSASGTKSKKVAVPLSATGRTKYQKLLPERGNSLAELDFFVTFCIKTKSKARNYGMSNKVLSLIEGNNQKVPNH